jgi:hypothetical protein
MCTICQVAKRLYIFWSEDLSAISNSFAVGPSTHSGTEWRNNLQFPKNQKTSHFFPEILPGLRCDGTPRNWIRSPSMSYCPFLQIRNPWVYIPVWQYNFYKWRPTRYASLYYLSFKVCILRIAFSKVECAIVNETRTSRKRYLKRGTIPPRLMPLPIARTILSRTNFLFCGNHSNDTNTHGSRAKLLS